jgi:uncharacterized 2Fe-2S/4Fe-4S cluster protein (DUF4445 family)
MTDNIQIELQPLGKSIVVKRGTPLQDVLFDYGVEFPCGGTGRCQGCRVRVVQGELPITEIQREMLSAEDLAQGWRLACACDADQNMTLDIGQWEAPILIDHTSFAFTPAEGAGIAIDLGTTTLAAQMVDLATGKVLAVQTGRNPQAVHGADIMSRVEFAMTAGGQSKLEELIRRGIGLLVDGLLEMAATQPERIQSAVLVGNTVMHHLFCGIEIAPLACYPFEPLHDGLQTLTAAQVGWPLPEEIPVYFLPCLGSFVGSDILAGILATRMHESDELNILIDLGTNGEIVVGTRDRMLCASTAAGPAFEGGRISMGMQAATGAISEVQLRGREFYCHVIGGSAPRGICGSGLVDAVAASLDLGLIAPSGRVNEGRGGILLHPPVELTQGDIRELQLAKGAIAAGVQILLERWGAGIDTVHHIYLAGAFGNYVSRQSARRIGLLDFPEGKIVPVGNSALLGAKIALFETTAGRNGWEDLRAKVGHISLASDPEFMEKYAEAMLFP